MKIEVGKFYKTREGEKVRIYAVDGHSESAIHGAIYQDGGYMGECWTADGHYFSDFPRITDGFDIVSEWEELVPTRQIIREHCKNVGISLDDSSRSGFVPNFDPNLVFTTAINGYRTSCNHSWKEYLGLMERYNYCEKCDEKQK